MRSGGAFGPSLSPGSTVACSTNRGHRASTGEVQRLRDAANRDWGSVEPAIFGTLFERSLDPNKRAQIGAHYTAGTTSC